MKKLFLVSHREEKLSQALFEQAPNNKNIQVMELAQFLSTKEIEEIIEFSPDNPSAYKKQPLYLRIFKTPESILDLFEKSQHEYINFEILSYFEAFKENKNIKSTLGKKPLCAWNQSLIEQWDFIRANFLELLVPQYEFYSDSSKYVNEDGWIYTTPQDLYHWKAGFYRNQEANENCFFRFKRPKGEAVHLLCTNKQVTFLNDVSKSSSKSLARICEYSKKIVSDNGSWIEEMLFFADSNDAITFGFHSPKISSNIKTENLHSFLSNAVKEL